jgi:hypothetical protein
MSKYIDSINMQAELINRLLDKIKARANPSGAEKPPYILEMEKLTVFLYGLGDNYENA